MFVLTELRRELRRSKNIVSASKESSDEISRQYGALDEKYKLSRERSKLERIPHLRRSIVRNFVKDLNEAKDNIDNNHECQVRKFTVQRFLNKLTSMHGTTNTASRD